MTTEEHIAAEVLLDYLEKRADEETAAQVRAHLDSGCARCAGELAVWTRVLTVLRSSQAAAPPEEVVERAIAIRDRTRDSRFTPKPSWRERIAARMQPSLTEACDAVAASLQLLFEAADTDIDLLCERRVDGWHIIGQALSTSAPEAPWRVSATGAAGDAATETDTWGEFRLAGLAPGVYEFTLCRANRRIVLPEVRLEGHPS